MFIASQFQRAFQLAYFIHGKRLVAIEIVIEALARLETSFSTQYKRLYYRPKGPSGPRANQSDQSGQLDDQSGQRYKPLLSDPVMLQRLIYVVSDTFERSQEDAEHVDAANLLLRYIKHLMMLTVARNSFHVAIGVSRLLYHYETVEASAIFQQLLPGTQRPRDESYWRARKGLLMKELKERFGDRLQLRRGASGEERFLAHQDSGQWNRQVEKCLEAFTPWETPCLLANQSTHDWGEIDKRLNREFGAGSLIEENHKEEMRLHTLIHPHCFAGLALAGGFGSPAARLEAPVFLSNGFSNGDGNGDGLGNTAAELTKDELDLIRRRLDKQSQLRRNVSPDSLRILINGFERACWMPSETGKFNFEITDEARTLEIRTDQAAGDLLLAHHLFDFDESASSTKNLNIVLEGGQRLSLTLTPLAGNDESNNWRIELSYRQPALTRLAKLVGLRSVFSGWQWHTARTFGYGLTVLLLGLTAALTWMFWPERPTFVAINKEAVSTPSPNATVEAIPAGSPSPIQKTTPESISRQTRDLNGQPNQSTALVPRKISILTIGEPAVNSRLVEYLRDHLAEAGQLTIAPEQQADAALKLSSNPDGSVTVWLVRPDGSVWWPQTGSNAGRRYTGAPEKIGAGILADLRVWITSARPAK